MKFACPICQGHIEADPAWFGQTTQCPHCDSELVVPTPPSGHPPPTESSTKHRKPIGKGTLILATAIVAIGAAISTTMLPSSVAILLILPLAIGSAVFAGVDARKHRVSISRRPYSLNTGALAWALTFVVLPFLGGVILGAAGVAALLVATWGHYTWMRGLALQTR